MNHSTTTVGTPVITVFDPFPVLTVTIEDREGGDEVHLHAGGQGLWVGRMAVSLGAQVRLISAMGGEAGVVLDRLIANEGIVTCGVSTAADSAVYVHDRRSGGARSWPRSSPPRSPAMSSTRSTRRHSSSPSMRTRSCSPGRGRG